MSPMKKQRIIIVGAGPVGCYAGQLLKKFGYAPLIIEEHREIGRPVHCAGLVGKKVIDEMQIPFPGDCILHKINGGTAYLGSERISIRREEMAVVIDREKFDKAMSKGLEVRYETRCLGVEQNNGHYILETDKGDLYADIIIGADGPNSIICDYVNSAKQRNFLKGVQFRMERRCKNDDMIEVFIDKPYFYWIIPEGNGIARVGVLSDNPYHDLLSFIKSNNLDGKIIEKFAGLVPLTHLSTFSKGKVFLVGDSASQVKPLSYGGIYMGMRSAEILAGCLNSGNYGRYNDLWKKRFEREITIALKGREIFQNLKDDELKKVFKFFKEKSGVIEKKADFENHSLLVWEFLKDPYASRQIMGILLKMIKAGLRRK
jgi:digeranylgeranylglycerophospholipid reductase